MANPNMLSGSFTRMLLETAQQHLTSKYYQTFLTNSGLDRYSQQLPEPNEAPAATYDECGAFMGEIYKVTQGGVYSLFSQNLGHDMAARAMLMVHWIELRQRIEQEIIQPNLPLEQALSLICEWKNQVPRQPLKWRTDGKDIFTERQECIFCYHIKADKPICFARKTYLNDVLEWLTGWRFMGEETECQACDGATCAYKFRVVSTRRNRS